MDIDPQFWSFFWALAALFLALAAIFFFNKSNRISHAATTSQPESSAEEQSSARISHAATTSQPESSAEQQSSARISYAATTSQPESSAEQQSSARISHAATSQPESSAEQQSSAPSSSNSPLPMEYEVFLSFRGPDVRTNFADFLHKYLVHSKIRTFLDDEELRKGEEIDPSLAKAIQESKVYIPILSPDYASSKWCLKELAKMVKCCKQGNGHIILPVFYMMEPRDVRHQEGSYKNAFDQHSKKYDKETITEWRESLEEVGKMKGWHVTKSDGQGAVVDQVFSMVWAHLTRDYMLVTDDLIGIDSHVENIKVLLQLAKCEAVKIVGIHGMGGIGKTTTAKALYNEVCGQFERFCFLEDVREMLSKTDGIVTLQKRIISGILRIDRDIKDVNEGINVIKNRICKLRVLVILDDADDRFKFEEIFGKLEDFCMGSRFIITTRNKRVMEFFQQYDLYELEEMNEDHSLQLFSRHAFGVNYPPKDYSALSMKFVKIAAGLPLALKVIGSLLFRKDEAFWEAKLKQLKDILPSQVQETLRISYLELTHEERQMFLDVSCFFSGEQKELPFYMWSDCGFHPEIAITTLIQRSLIKINKEHGKNVFWMHDHTRDLGRTIICEEDLRCPWKRSRIWSREDALDMLTYEQGTDRLEVLSVEIKDENLMLTDRQFEKLSGLRYLKVEGGGFTGNFERILPNLRWLELVSCRRGLPININMRKLVILSMSSCPVVDGWRGWERIKVAHKLKYITLSSCRGLRMPPDLSRCGNLEFIRLYYCKWMRGELCIDNLKNLKVLNLVGTGITKLTGDIGTLQNLQEIYSWELELPAGICSLSSLEIIDLQSEESMLKQVPALPASLKRLYLSSPCVPNLLDLKNLEELQFYKCHDPEIPGEIWKLSKLKTLKLWLCSCKSLLMEDSGNGTSALPSSLSRLVIDLCNSLERLPNLSNLSTLTELVLTGTSVREILGLGEMRMLETLKISHSPHISSLDGLEHLVLLKKLSVSCGKLEKLPSLSNLTKLDTLEITHCWLISEIHGLCKLRESLSLLEIRNCPSLAYTEGLGCLDLSATTEQLLPSLSNLVKLRKLILGLDHNNDEDHILSREQFLDLSALCNVNMLSITSSKRLTLIKGCERLESLDSLYIHHCTAIEKLPNLSGLKNLKKLDILGCTQLTDVMGLENLESLQELRICNCTSIKKLPDLSCLKHLHNLDITGCRQLTEVIGIEKLKELQWLTIDEKFEVMPLESQAKIFRR